MIELEVRRPSMEAALERVEPRPGLDESIARIDALRDKKMCLFVGRTPREPLPSDRGLSTADEVWVSGDISADGPAISKDRIHLCFDFNNQDLILKLQHRFDLIVVDLSVIKFFTEDFANRFSIMLRSSVSQMLFESTIEYMNSRANMSKPTFSTERYIVTFPVSISEGIQARKDDYFNNYQKTTSPEQKKLDWDAFMETEGNAFLKSVPNWSSYDQRTSLENNFMNLMAEKAGIREEDEYRKLKVFARQQLQRHLEKTFAHVELVENRPCQYWTYDCTSYFIISGPKKQASCCQLV